MARKNQRLINFHTSGLTSMPVASDVHYGEIVVRHNKQQPELLIKVSESEFGVIPGSGAVASAISVAAKNVTDYIDGEVNTIESSITELQKAVSAVSTNIGENYVSKKDFEKAQGDLFTSATTVASNDATAKATKAKDDAIAAAAASATTLLGLVDAVDDKVDADVKALADYKTEVSNTYATQTGVTSDIKDAKDSVYSSATTVAAADATAKANKAKEDAIAAAAASAETLNNSIEAVDGKVDTVSTSLDTFKTDVANTYATQTGVTSDIATAKSEAISAAAADAQEKANTAKSEAIAAAAASAKTLSDKIDGVDNKVGTLSGNVETAIQNLETGLTATINKKVATAYRYQKTVTNYADLPTSEMSKDTVGYVYNVENANDNYPAGTNYAWNGTEWDALGGSVDLSPYALKTEVTEATKTLQDNIDAANGRINTVSGDLNTFKATVANTYETKDNVTTAITTAKDSVYLSATTVAFAEAKSKADAAQTAAINAAAASAQTLQTNIDAANGRIDTVSTSLNTFKTDVAKTYETKDNVTTAITAAKNSVYSSATTAAATDAQSKADGAKNAAIKAAAASAQTLQNNIDAVNSSVTGLSASTVSIETTANSAIQTASIVDKDTCKVSVSKVNTELKFDFRNIVIDCGDF